MTDIDDEAERLVDAALNGDAEALEDGSDNGDDEPPAPTARLIIHRPKAETAEHAMADMLLRPTTQAAGSVFYLAHYGKTFAHEKLTVDELIRFCASTW